MLALKTRREEMDVELAMLDAQLNDRWAEIPQPIAVEWSEAPVLTLDRGTPWLVGPAERDPARSRTGHAIIPREQRAQLQRIRSTGVRFDRVAIAHELDPAGPVRPLLPLLERGARPCSDNIAHLVVGRTPPHPRVERAARALDNALGGALATVRESLDSLLDPIVFGVVAPGGPRVGEPSLWYPLVAWRW
jgi:hypothetical protein